MSDAPERIATNTRGPGGELLTTEYVREDLIAALEAAGNRLREAVEQVVHDLDAGIYGGVTALGYLRAALEEGGGHE